MNWFVLMERNFFCLYRCMGSAANWYQHQISCALRIIHLPIIRTYNPSSHHNHLHRNHNLINHIQHHNNSSNKMHFNNNKYSTTNSNNNKQFLIAFKMEASTNLDLTTKVLIVIRMYRTWRVMIAWLLHWVLVLVLDWRNAHSYAHNLKLDILYI